METPDIADAVIYCFLLTNSLICLLSSRGVVVNFDLGERFPRHVPATGELAPPRTACSRSAVGAVGGRHLPLRGSGGITPRNFFEIFDAKFRVWGQFGPENKLIAGQPNEYDVICRNASVLAFHLWPTIFASPPFRLQSICRNGVPPRSRSTTPLLSSNYSKFGYPGTRIITRMGARFQKYLKIPPLNARH